MRHAIGMVRRIGRLAALLGLSLLLAACGGLVNLPGSGPAPDLFDLTPKTSFDAKLPQVAVQLVIEEPTAARPLDSDRVALRPSATEIKYFAGARWSDRAPKMVQRLLVESFENTDKIVAVGPQSIGLRADYILKSDLREFQAEYFDIEGTPRVRVRLNVKLIKMPEARIVASRTFERTVVASATDTRAIVAAFDETLGKVMRRAVEWTLRETRAGGGSRLAR